MGRVLRGQEMMLWVDSFVVAASTNCKISLSADTEDASTKDDGIWAAPNVAGLKWSVSNESFEMITETFEKDGKGFRYMKDLFVLGDPVIITIGKPTNYTEEGLASLKEAGWQEGTGSASEPIYQGMAIITSMDMDMTKGSKAKVTISLEGVGPLKTVTGAP